MSDNNNHEMNQAPPMEVPQPAQNPKATAAQRAMMKLLATKPESIIELLDRVGVSWERTTLHGDSVVVIKWFDLMKGERKLQEQGPFFKKVMEDIRKEQQEGKFDEQPGT